MKYRAGDRVRVRSDLKACKQYGSNIATSSMEGLAGKIVTISRVGYAHYLVEGMNCNWTDEMLEPVEEMSAEEAILTFGEVCKDANCWHCPIKEIDREHSCTDIKISHPEEVVKILKQWKADHEKKPIETEFIWYLLVVEEKTHIVKYEKPLKIERERTTDEQKEELLREWCSEHDGKYYVTTERRCVVKE